MNNPWNTKFDVSGFSDEHGRELNVWCNNFLGTKSKERKLFLVANPPPSAPLDYMMSMYGKGYGMKLLARWMSISYTNFRTIFIKYLKLEMRKGQSIVTEPLRKFRSDRVSGDKSHWYKWPEKHPEQLKKSETGIQGFWKQPNGEYIYLRSTWEYIFVKWLIKHGIKFAYEVKTFRLSNGESYRPDFFIGENSVVEIKAPKYNSRKHKQELFRNEYPEYELIVITDIGHFTEIGYYKELKEWKRVKLKHAELSQSRSSQTETCTILQFPEIQTSLPMAS